MQADNPALYTLFSALVWLAMSILYGLIIWQGTVLSYNANLRSQIKMQPDEMESANHRGDA